MPLADAWVVFDAVNILLTIVAIICAVLAVICFNYSGRSDSPAMLGCAFIGLAIMCVVLGLHGRTTDILHVPMAHRDLSKTYGATDIHVDLQDHWARVHIPGCKPYVKNQLRRIPQLGGQYRFATTYQIKDPKSGDLVNRYAPIPKNVLVGLCVKQAPLGASGNTVVALGN